ncbi:MAG: N-acetylmuramoyl-L-alanine amidase [Desulfobacteraceae bacterium]|nr:N-acetylmuramoyl-L-alanine amidase [Desulfobacteraceae bacterium]
MLNKTKTILKYGLLSIIISLLIIPSVNASNISKRKFIEAETAYRNLKRNSKDIKKRDMWLLCIKKFQAVYKYSPSDPWAAAGLYNSGLLYHELYKLSGRESDKNEAIDIFKRIIKRYPKSAYRIKSKEYLRIFSKKVPKTDSKIIVNSKKKPVFQKNKNKPLKKKNNLISQTVSQGSMKAIVNYMRYSTYPDFTRVVVETDKETLYNHGFLKKDIKNKKPMRMYLDIKNSKLCDRLKKTLPEKENHLIIPVNKNLDLRISQYMPSVVRVVMYNMPHKGFEFRPENYKLKEYFNPYRIVIDINNKTPKRSLLKKVPIKTALVTKKKLIYSNKNISAGAIAKQLALGVSRIVIDPGHGGRDSGASGYLKGVYEKNINLLLAKKLSAKIRKNLKYDVILTRSTDSFLTLEERTEIANKNNADLFISIHANASRQKKAFGIETYLLNLATDDEAIRVAARENATSKKNISDLQSILTELMQNAKIGESKRLAYSVQNSMYKNMKKKYKKIKNKGVKQAPFYVLLGAKMPSILIETAFISNPMECKRLINSTYQDRLCEAIIKGINHYIKETNPDLSQI